MRFLTKIEFLKKEVYAHNIFDAYRWHQILWKAFPGYDGQTRKFLFRIDEKKDAFLVYLLSPVNPTPLEWGKWSSKQIKDSFFDGNFYLFQLRANPTKRLGIGQDKGKRVGIYKEDELKMWLQRKIINAGSSLEEYSISAPISEFFIKNNRKNKLNRVDFSGIIRVNNREKFINAFENGIGSAKSFGFGLFVIQKLR